MKIKSAIKTIFSMDVFKAIFLLVSVLGVCPISAVVVTPLLKVFHLYGFAVVIFDLLGEKRLLKNSGRLILVLFSLSYCMTILTNLELLNFSGISNFVYLLWALAIVFSYGKMSEKVNKISSMIICFAITATNIVGIVMFYLKFCMYVHPYGYVGMYIFENRLCGLFGNPNVLGLVCLIGICLSAILYFYTAKKYSFIFIITGVINMITLLLSNSRTQIISVAAIAAVYVFLILFKNKISFKRFIVSSLAGVLAAAIVLGGGKVVQFGLAFTDYRYGYYLAHIDGGEEVHSKYPLPKFDKDDYEKGFGFGGLGGLSGIIDRESTGLNGRPELWAAGFKIFGAYPIFGGGLDNHNNSLTEIGSDLIGIGGNLHNSYLDLLAACGLGGFGCFIAFLVIMLLKTKNYFLYSDKKNYCTVAMLIAIVLGFMLDAVADSTFIASFYPSAIAFWFFMAWLAALLEKAEKDCGKYKEEPLFTLYNRLINKQKAKKED